MPTPVSRRSFLLSTGGLAAATGLPAALFHGAASAAADGKTLTIAYNLPLPTWDPTAGASAANPAVQSIYKAVFDTYIDQNPDLSFRPGMLTKWGWNKDRTKIELEVRAGAKWHDGSPVTADDVAWSLERAGDPKSGNPIQFLWGKIGNFKVSGQKVTADVKEFEPALFKWMAFLTAYVLPRKAFTAAGAGWEDKPVGSGPYMVEKTERNAYVRLKAFPGYWGPKPAFETVIFKFVPDATSRVAELESGGSDLTLEIPFEEYNRLTQTKGFGGVTTPVSDIGMIFISNREPLLDENVRLAMIQSVDKKAIVDKLLLGFGVPIDTLQAPQYAAFDKTIRTKYDPEGAKALLARSGYSAANPVKFTIQTTRGMKAKDYEMIQAIVGMWRKVGIEASIEVYEIARHFELRARHELAPAAFYNWGNAIGDPSTSTGFAMFSHSPHSAWKTEDVDAKIGPLWGEKDETKRILGYRAVDKYIADKGLVLPLLQYVQPVVFRKGLKFTPHIAGFVLPQNVTRA